MKITIEDKDYEIDIQRAKELGICKEVRKPISSFMVGDVFTSRSGERILILQAAFAEPYAVACTERYNIAGIDGLCLFPDFRDSEGRTATKDELLKFLNKNQWTFASNINNKVKELIKKA